MVVHVNKNDNANTKKLQKSTSERSSIKKQYFAIENEVSRNKVH